MSVIGSSIVILWYLSGAMQTPIGVFHQYEDCIIERDKLIANGAFSVEPTSRLFCVTMDSVPWTK